MSLENTHLLMGFYMEGLILGVNTLYRLICFYNLFPIGCIGLKLARDLGKKCRTRYSIGLVRGGGGGPESNTTHSEAPNAVLVSRPLPKWYISGKSLTPYMIDFIRSI